MKFAESRFRSKVAIQDTIELLRKFALAKWAASPAVVELRQWPSHAMGGGARLVARCSSRAMLLLVSLYGILR